MVSHAEAVLERAHSTLSCGMRADAENHSRHRKEHRDGKHEERARW